MQTQAFKTALSVALAATPVAHLLQSKPAIVLERIARGGGVTKWYCCLNDLVFGRIMAKLNPGSIVSFYFDDRIQSGCYSLEIKEAVEMLIRQSGELVIGTLAEDGVCIDAQIISGPNELAEYLLEVNKDERVFYGPFPAKDNDGIRAVTLVLPDADGIVRSHPH